MLHQLLAAGSYNKPQLICVECGAPTASLYREYSKGNIRLTRCTECTKVVDKYVEWDSTLMFIEMLLQRKAVYRHLLYNFLPAPHLGYTAWALARVCVFLVLLEVLGRQYAYSATLGAGRLEGLRRIDSANITSHSPAMAMLPFNEPKFVWDTVTFTANAFAEGTAFALGTMLAAWCLRHPRWRSGLPRPPSRKLRGDSDADKGAHGVGGDDAPDLDGGADSDVEGGGGAAQASPDAMEIQWVAARCVAGLPNKLLPWHVRQSKKSAEAAHNARAGGVSSDPPLPAAGGGAEGADTPAQGTDGMQRRKSAAAKAAEGGSDHPPAPAPAPVEASRRVRMVSPKDSEGNATWQFFRSAVAAMILGSFGRLAAVLVVIWAYPPQFVSAIGAFVLVSHVTSLGAALDVNQCTATLLVCVGLVARLAVRAVLYAADCAPDVPIL